MAKLVDILARELKVWPEDCEAIEQDRRGSCIFKVNGPAISTYVEAIADDADTAKVTRAQWQTAVDALKAEKLVEWNGEGLPPVGADVEIGHGDDWTRCKIIAHALKEGVPMAVFTYAQSFSGETDVNWCVAQGFRPIRPIRTPEQIAAEERDQAIEDLYFTINWNEGRETWPIISSGRKADYAKAIDAGYRKQK